MKKLERLMAITTILQSKKFVTANQIAERYDISTKTVYRDIRALMEIGVPIGFQPSKGYFIADGYFLQPLALTRDEANALILLSKLSDRFTDHSIANHSATALHKIKAALRPSEKQGVDSLSEQMDIYVPQQEKNNNSWLSAIQNAIVNNTVLHIRYKDNQGNETTRDIEPIGLIFYTYQWHLFAWCLKRAEYRDFKVNGILALRDTLYKQTKDKELGIADYLKTLST